jgi:YggT family protein
MDIPDLLTWTLGPLLGVMSVFFVFRIVLTWYPQVEFGKFPWIVLYWPTEPLLAVTRRLVPPIGGVDITPIIWFGIISLIRELLLGQQGILRML